MNNMDSCNSLVAASRISNNTIENEDSTVDSRLEHINYAVNVIQARNIYLKGLIFEGREIKKRGNITETYLDVTQVCKSSLTKMNELWSVIEARQLKSAGLKTALYNSIGYQMLSKQVYNNRNSQSLSLGGTEEHIENIFALPTQLVKKSEELKIVCQKQEEINVASMTAQRNTIDLISEAQQNINANNLLEPTIKHKERCIQTKIARLIINTLLSKTGIDYRNQRELLKIKFKWRVADSS